MPGRSKVLQVPYFVQPTGVTCQSTVLKMMAAYLEHSVVLAKTGAADRDILTIWKDINQDPKRPDMAQNAHANMKWWLESHFPSLKFRYQQTNQEDQAVDSIVRFIDSGFPVLVSVSHARVPGHIILVTGYENYLPNMSSSDFRLVVHDPYGRFDPSLLSDLFGQKRWEGGASLLVGGQAGPGQGNRIFLSGASRQRAGDAVRGTYYLLAGSR
ncbi:MAG TPA: C39 family peptidase [Candidatus Acidoferrales bacterium]|nr:C39 family peptidase [Candidatus Acidoferrales bacterium]